MTSSRHPEQRSFAEQLLHAAGSCYRRNPVMGQKPPRQKIESATNTNQGRHRCVRQEILRRWRNRHPGKPRKRHDAELKCPLLAIARSRHSIRASSGQVNTAASSLCTTASPGLCHRSRGPASQAQVRSFDLPQGVNEFYKKGCQKSSPSTGREEDFRLEIQPCLWR